MNKNLFPVLILFIAGIPAVIKSQTTHDLYRPAEIRKAYAAETRNPDGTPGKNYFQNRAEYAISAEFFPDTKILTGTEKVKYFNNSNDTLARLCFNLYQNLYKKGTARDSDVDPVNIHDGVEIRKISVNGLEIKPESFRSFSTIFIVPVAGRILPHTTAEILIEWQEKMPVTAVDRQGTYHESSYFIGYWYPKICVYDDIEGWNTAGHTGQAEFYSDYADYKVDITMPGDYTVWSSGTLVNGAGIYTPEFLKRLDEAAGSDSILHLISASGRKEGRILQKKDKHTWSYILNNRMDFAFAASNTYLWDATSQQTNDGRVLVNAVYSKEAKTFSSIAGICRRSIDYFSAKMPAIPYPEKQITIFDGGPGGMEFPGMVNEEDYSDEFMAAMVMVHELAHLYLPFDTGINEQKYGWMDEGFATLVGFLAFNDQMKDSGMNMMQMMVSQYAGGAGSQASDVPVMIASHKLGDFSYGFVTYIKPMTAFYLLYDYLGADKFAAVWREFTNRWQGRHPIPYDLFATFNAVAGEDLAWFWKPWFFEYGYSDLALGKIEQGRRGNLVTVVNVGKYPVPVNLSVKYQDGTTETISRKMDIWKEGADSVSIRIRAGKISEVVLNGPDVPEATNNNNRLKFD